MKFWMTNFFEKCIKYPYFENLIYLMAGLSNGLGPKIFDPGFQNPGFFDPEKNLILNPVLGPDLKFNSENL